MVTELCCRRHNFFLQSYLSKMKYSTLILTHLVICNGQSPKIYHLTVTHHFTWSHQTCFIFSKCSLFKRKNNYTVMDCFNFIKKLKNGSLHQKSLSVIRHFNLDKNRKYSPVGSTYFPNAFFAIFNMSLNFTSCSHTAILADRIHSYFYSVKY